MGSVPPLLLAATVDELRRHAPFDAMAPAELELLASRLSLRYYAAGEDIVTPEAGPVRMLHIVQRGRVEGTPATFPSFHATAVRLGPGESFPVGALIGRRATTLRYTASTDAFCYLLPQDAFHEVMAASQAFHSFCTQRLAHLLEQSAREVRETFAGRAAQELGMGSALASAVLRAPVTLPGTATLRQALETMKSEGVGSVVLVDGAGRPEGIFTRTDILDRVALAGTALDSPVARVMTRDPVRLPETSSIAEGAERMARGGFRHLLVMRGERLAGVISERDLFALQRRSAQGLRKAIAHAQAPEALAHAARDASGLAASLLAQGIGAEPLMHLVTAMNDAIVARAVEITRASHGLEQVPFCWIGLGSEGRMEQTLATDQDNAIVIDDRAVERRAALLGFAREVNATLAACGFPLCKGDIMAGNPRWCLSLAEWRERFDDWMRNTSPEALMNAAIFFDFRPLAGTEALARELRAFVSPTASRRPVFLRGLAAAALEVRPPLGFFDELPGERASGDIDLKRQAGRPFVDAARILALAAGVDATGTAERLRAAGPAMRMGQDEVASAVQAFHFVQMLRLRAQESAAGLASGADRNRIAPGRLNSLDQRILKESLRQVRKLQNRIALEYQL